MLQTSANCMRGPGKGIEMTTLLKLPDLEKHKQRADKQVKQILKALAVSDMPKYERESCRYLRSYSARVVAADYVHRRTKEGDRFPSIEEFQTAVESVDLFRPIGEPVDLKLIPKGTGGDCRLVQGFTFRQRVAHRVVDNLFREIGRTHPEQFAMRGGVNAAISHLKALIEGKEKVWIAHLDIQSAYVHVNRKVVEELIPLPNVVTREQIFLSDHSPLQTKSHKLTPPIGNDLSASVEGMADAFLAVRGFKGGVRSGLSQGAICSPIILEMLIASDLIELNLTEFSCYADNFCITASSREDLVAKVKALRAKLKANPSGPFHLEGLFIGEARQGFDFLGYHLTLRNGKVDVRPADNNLQKIENKYRSLMREYKNVSATKRLRAIGELEKQFRTWSATFSQSTDMERVLKSKRNKARRLKKQVRAQIASAVAKGSGVSEPNDAVPF